MCALLVVFFSVLPTFNRLAECEFNLAPLMVSQRAMMRANMAKQNEKLECHCQGFSHYIMHLSIASPGVPPPHPLGYHGVGEVDHGVGYHGKVGHIDRRQFALSSSRVTPDRFNGRSRTNIPDVRCPDPRGVGRCLTISSVPGGVLGYS